MRPFSRILSAIAMAAALVSLVAMLGSQPAPREQVGPLPGGGFLLNSGWVLDPVGKQVPLDTLPMSTALSPDGKYLLVLNGGYRPPSISVHRHRVRRASRAACRWRMPGWASPSLPSGDRVYVGGGSKASVFEFTFADGTLTAARTFPVPSKPTTHASTISSATWPSRPTAACSTRRTCITIPSLVDQSAIGHGDRTRQDRPPAVPHPVPSRWKIVLRHQLGRRHAGPLRHLERRPTGARSAGRASHRHGLARRRRRRTPTAMSQPHMPRACSSPRPTPTACTPWASPQAKELQRGGEHQHRHDAAAAAGHDALRRWRSAPTASGCSWPARTPTWRRWWMSPGDAATWRASFPPAGIPRRCARCPSGTLVVLNGKGVRSYPNPNGPNPAAERARPVHAGVPASRVRGATCRPARPRGSSPSPTSNSTAWTADGAWPTRPIAIPSWTTASPLPPIEHVIYIVKENRTYDQVLGDMKEGNGDASLVLFGENVTPNQHKMAREFVLLDNFYVNADVSADGHNWSTAAIAPDYVQKLWPEQLRRPPQDLRLRRAGPGRRCRRPAISGPTPPGRALACAITATWWRTTESRALGRRPDRPGPRSGAAPRSPTRLSAASTSTIPTWSAPRSSSPTRGIREDPATCRD